MSDKTIDPTNDYASFDTVESITGARVRLEFTMGDGSVKLHEQENAKALVFCSLIEVEGADGKPEKKVAIYFSGTDNQLHNLFVSLLDSMNEAGFLRPALLCHVTGSHEGDGEDGEDGEESGQGHVMPLTSAVPGLVH